MPGGHLAAECFEIGDAPGETLRAQDAHLDLRYFEPTPVLGRVVDLQLVSQPLGFIRCEGLVEGAGCGRVQVIQDQDDLLGVEIAHLDQVFDLLGPVVSRPLLRHARPAHILQRLRDQEYSNTLAVPLCSYS